MLNLNSLHRRKEFAAFTVNKKQENSSCNLSALMDFKCYS